jgi:hypothetical protein
MNHRLLAVMALTAACSTGLNYPDRYANEFCKSAYVCIGAEDVEAVTLWDNEAECAIETANIVMQDPGYEGYEEGDCTYDPAAAKACIAEVAQIRSDVDCDGDMGYIAFLTDSLASACANVYDC